jgi:hypothetical protein
MKEPAPAQLHTERLLDLTNAMLLAAIDGRLEELRSLEQQRECVYAKLPPDSELGEPDVLRLADALASISLADEIICHLTAEECPAAITCGRTRKPAATSPAKSHGKKTAERHYA